MRYRHKRWQSLAKIQDFSNARRVHACFLGHVAEHPVADVLHVLGNVAEVEVVGERGDHTGIIQLVVIVNGEGPFGG
jgi:hypothetical protein